MSFFTFMLGVGIRVGRQGNSEISSKNTDIKTKVVSLHLKIHGNRLRIFKQGKSFRFSKKEHKFLNESLFDCRRENGLT